MEEITCRYCSESAEEKDMILFPTEKVINGELIVTHASPRGMLMSRFMCLECLKGEFEAMDGRWPHEF